jgi:predicted secreted Zn-dependent protease
VTNLTPEELSDQRARCIRGHDERHHEIARLQARQFWDAADGKR